MTHDVPRSITTLKRQYPDVPEHCFGCPCWDSRFPNACDRFYSEVRAWKMPQGCPVYRGLEGRT